MTTKTFENANLFGFGKIFILADKMAKLKKQEDLNKQGQEALEEAMKSVDNNDYSKYIKEQEKANK